MGLFGSIAGGTIGAVGSILGGISASKAMKKVRNNLREQQQENETWYNRRYNEDVTQRADAQRILSKTEELMRDRNRQAAGTQAVMGGAEESVAASKAANSQAMAEAASQIAVAGNNRKDQIEQAYQQKDAQLDDALNNLEINKSQAIATAVKGVGQAAGGLMTL